jgi:hypothetical protein
MSTLMCIWQKKQQQQQQQQSRRPVLQVLL